jgi:hypothetical protein
LGNNHFDTGADGTLKVPGECWTLLNVNYTFGKQISGELTALPFFEGKP